MRKEKEMQMKELTNYLQLDSDYQENVSVYAI